MDDALTYGRNDATGYGMNAVMDYVMTDDGYCDKRCCMDGVMHGVIYGDEWCGW